MREIKESIVHIASFAGNIGDIINHSGFYKSFGIDKKSVRQIEIRRFYHNCNQAQKLFFDNRLAEYINQSELLILGGGGFFDVYWDESDTGTTIDMPKSFIDQIKVPVLVNAMGVHFVQGKKRAKEKFYSFLNDITSRDNWYVSIRNDGSAKRLKNVYHESLPDNLKIVPDAGFMIDTECRYSKEDHDCMIGFSITNELLDPGFIGNENIDLFNDTMRNILTGILDANKEICFFIHGPQDFNTLNILIDKMGMEKFRTNITVAPYAPYGRSDGGILDYYRKCDAVVGMRFHSNVIAIAENIPVLGVAIHAQITDLYEELGINDQCVKIGDEGYENLIMDGINKILIDYKKIREKEKQCMIEITSDYKKYVNESIEFLKSNNTYII